MPTNLLDAHRQWASRPPDERFESLETLQSFTNSRKSSPIEAERVLKMVDLKVLPEGSIPNKRHLQKTAEKTSPTFGLTL